MAGMTRPRSSNTTETCNDDPNLVHHRRFLGIWIGLYPIRLDPGLQRGRHRPESRQARPARGTLVESTVDKLDVTAAGDADQAVAAAVKRLGRVDVLINNAGYGIVGALEETSDSELRAQMETNFFGAINVTKAVLPSMRTQRAGAIVNISSLGGQLSFGGFSAYSASKFALEGMSEALAAEVAAFGIKVMIVEPGAFRTGFASDAMRHMPMMDAYRDVIGATRDFAHGMNGSQEGDPAKAALAIDTALRSDKTPLRLQLGTDAVSSIRAHAEQLLRDLGDWESVANATRVDAAAASGSLKPQI
jgi:NAD(P)-dependent dehydrogenase (short-subunit alcohol dehydrogenase family)